MADDKDTKATKVADTGERERPTTAERLAASKEAAVAEREAREAPADIAPAPATSIDASGSIMEPQVKKAVPVDHPAVDNNPRAGTTELQNKADFNDPSLDSEEAVKRNLEAQR